MIKITRSKNYTAVSNIYDHLMRKVRYDYWADYIYALTSNHLIKNPKVLELASGNCQLAGFLSAYYAKYIASDYSLSMLGSHPKIKLRKICCDMTSLPFKVQFDLIVSAFDSVNYILSKIKLSNLFREVQYILKNKGLFTFDVSLENNSYKHVKDPIREGTYKGIKYQQLSDYDLMKKLHRNIFYITYPNGMKFKEIHNQKIYPFESYFDLLDSAGFSVKACYDAFTFKDASPNSLRVQFVVNKK